MYQPLQIEIVGAAPLIMKNGQTADPLNRYAKAIKEISGKRKKTDADYAEMAHIEFLSGLYMDSRGPIIPAHVISAMTIAGARISKSGKKAEASIIVDKHASLIYDGPRTAQELWEDERFRHVVPVRVGQVKVIRTRPIFYDWSAVIEISYLPDVLNEAAVILAVRSAGQLSGIGDNRPRYGRFALRQDIAPAPAKVGARTMVDAD
jgi:hypothetical protein